MSDDSVHPVSVVIPTFNRVDLLCSVLPSYLQPQVVAEVIVVNDSGTDGTEQRIRRWMVRRLVGARLDPSPAPFDGLGVGSLPSEGATCCMTWASLRRSISLSAWMLWSPSVTARYSRRSRAP